MVGWPVIGLLGKLPRADHDGGFGSLFYGEKEGVLCFGCWPCGTHHPPRTAQPDALNIKPHLSFIWAV